MAVTNMMEQVIKQKLDAMLETTDCCKCKKCYSDMLAIALNTCKPKYVNSREGELIVKIGQTELQNSIDIDIAVAKAIKIVCNNPKH